MRSDSLNNEVNNLADALADLPLPKEAGTLTKVQKAMYQAYGRGKATKDWFDHELIMLADLCRLTDQLVKERRKLKREGLIVAGRLGDTSNPRAAVINSFSTQQQGMIRTLGLSSMKMNKQSVVHRANKQKEARDQSQPTMVRPSLLAVPSK